MPWRLSDDEPTVVVKLSLPVSLRDWLKSRAKSERGVPAFIRSILEREKKRADKVNVLT